MTDREESRIAKEEEFWTAPRLFGVGVAFLFACIVLIYVMASV